MGCNGAVLTKLQLKNHTIICLTFEMNTIQAYKDKMLVFRSSASNLLGIQKSEEKNSKFVDSFTNITDGLRAKQFQGTPMNDFAVLGDLLTLSILFQDKDFVQGNIIGKLAEVCRNVETLGYY